MRTHDLPRAAQARLGRSGLLLAVGLALALIAPARANPLTEVPGAGAAQPDAPAPPRDPAAERGEAEEARTTNPSATAIIRALAPFADGNPGAPATPLAVSPDDGGPAVRVDPARSVDLTVFFAYDSARLTPEARIQLEPLGEALRARSLAGHAFLIVGHTDAAGGRAYNRRLSLARARTVRAHLVDTYGIAPTRLRVHGWGPAQPKDRSAPLSRVNRRVEVSLIAPSRSGALHFVVPVADGACTDLLDPRPHVALDLDDFGAAPTPRPCAE